MIKKFENFEFTEEDLIGRTAVLINKEMALCRNVHDGKFLFEDTQNAIGWSIVIKRIRQTKDNETLISGYDGDHGYYNLKNFKIKEKPTRIYSKDDPYGEEIWNESLNEEYAFPKSGKDIKDYLVKFITDKFDWWLNRKGPANYSEDFILHMDDIDPSISKNKDFPLAVLTLKLNIVKNKDNNSIVTGSVAPYRTKRQVKDFDEYAHIYRGKIYNEISIFIYAGDRTIQVQEIKEEIETTVTHELQHVYNGYKKMMNKLHPKNDIKGSIFSNCLINLADKYNKTDKFSELLYTYYPFTSNKEYDAFMSEFSATGIKNKMEIKGYKNIIKMINIDFDTLYDEILKEFQKRYPKVILNQIPKHFVETVVWNWSERKIEKPEWIYNYYTDFRSFVKLLHDDLKKRSDKMIKKSDKIFYSK